MRARSDLRQRLLNQAIHGFRQRHPEVTIAAAELDLAETLHVSPASVQKWRSGYPISPAHIPGLVRWAIVRAGMSPVWAHSFLRACDYGPSDLAAMLPQAAPPPHLPQACRQAHLRLWGRDRLEAATLHAPRPALLTLLDNFLASDQPGLLLVAPSGMGKTAFALWLARQETVQGRIVLACPAGIVDGERPFPELLASLLPDLPLIPGEAILSWPLLVILDGVNESPDMVRLTWQVDRVLLRTDGLKVLLTFRPESFQILRHGLELSTHHYYNSPLLPDTDGLLHDPPAYRLLPFTPAELPPVYERYREAYHLQPPFPALSLALREHLRHPLTLRLVAEIWAGQSIPETLQEEHLIQHLLEGLYRRGRLGHTDIRFLEEQVVARMVVPGRWRNSIPTAEMVAEGTVLPIQHPFTRLADAGILSSTNGRLDEPIRFAHDRFYEHFAERRLRQMRDAAPEPAAFYARLGNVPWFLHGPLRRLVAEEIARAGPPSGARPLWAALATLPLPVLAGALEDACRAHPEEAVPFLQALWRLTRSPLRAPAPWQRSLQRALLTAAGTLGESDLLLEFLPAADEASRSTGILVAKDLWASHPDAAAALLNGLARRLFRPPGLPDMASITLFGQIFLLSLFDYGDRPEVLASLGSLIRDLARRATAGLRGRLLVHLAAVWFTGWLKRAAAEAHLSSDLDRDFRLSPEERAHLRALAPYVDWETPGFSRPETHAHLIGALETGSLLAGWITILAIVQQGMGNPSEGWVEVRRILAEMATSPCPLWAEAMSYGICELLRRSPTDEPEVWRPLEQGLTTILSGYPTWHEALRAYRPGRPAALPGPATGLAPYILARDAVRLPVEEGPVWEVVQRKLQRGDAVFAMDYLREMRFVALDGRRPRLALRLLEPLAACPDPAVRNALADLLELLRGIVSEDVRDYLERVAPPELAALVGDPPEEPPTHTWLYYRLEDWVYPFLLRTGSARRLIADLFTLAAEAESVLEWAEAGIQRILQALNTPEGEYQ
jgi:hypothetical protein